MSARQGLTMIRASAGSGKTHRLTQEVCDAVAGDTRVEGLVAVTFTTRAAAELEARIRRTLVRLRAFDKAQRLPLAHLGTVHAVCLRLVQQMAFAAGLSPNLDVLPDDGGQLLREALEDALEPAFRARMDVLASGLGVEVDPIAKRFNWQWPVAEVMDLARQNRIRAEALRPMGRRSADEIAALLPAPVGDGALLDDALRHEIEAALQWMPDHQDGTVGTKKACRAALQLMRESRDPVRPVWTTWVKLAAIEPTKASRARFAPLQVAAAAYERHPAYHTDLRELTRGVFEAARLGLVAFDRWKRERGLVDYTDMIDQALAILDEPAAATALGGRLDLVVVDEFQDTSPLQLALFARLHALAGRSIWVGDRKQCIFEFAGADPALIDAVARWAAVEGGRVETIGESRRSRPELVEACSAVFAAAFARFGLSPDEVEVRPHRRTPAELAPLPPVGLWWLDAAKNADEADAISSGVRRLLDNPVATPVVDRATGLVRPLQPGDVAVLVDTNERADLLAAALHGRGIATAHARAGLLDTPEGAAVDAALRWLLDARDTLSEAVLDALHGFGGQVPGDWLAGRLRRMLAQEEIGVVAEWRERLEPIREVLRGLSPTEAVDRVIDALDLLRIASAWPEPTQRRGNIDAIRSLARVYEDRCVHRREAATVAGLIRFFDHARTPVLTREGASARDEQHVAAGGHAVTVSTYHKAKGLEWPVVVLGSLDRPERRTAFGVHPEADRPAFDAGAPLEGRRVRYWPRPFGNAKVPLVQAAAASVEGRAVSEREDHERVRLLYVGMTRARDHLVLAVRAPRGCPEAAWLDELADSRGPLFDLSSAAREGTTVLRARGLSGAAVEIGARAWSVGRAAMPDPDPPAPEVRRWFERPPPAPIVGRYGIAPSRAADEWPELAPARVIGIDRLGDPLWLPAGPDVDWAALGVAVHDFLAADHPNLSPETRARRAERRIAACGLAGLLPARTMIEASDRLRAWVGGRWPAAKWRHEVPIEARIDTPDGARLVSGRIDLLLEVPEGLVVVDHKTFPATGDAVWRKAAREHGAQVMAYAEALRRVQRREVVGGALHFPLGGGLVKLGVRDVVP